MAVDLRALAAGYRRDRFPDRPPDYRRPTIRLDPEFCRAVARFHDRAPAWSPAAEDSYRVLRDEGLRQYRVIRSAGVVVRPWREAGQPYPDSRSLIDQVTRTGVLWVYLTRSGHGSTEVANHPLRAPSGVVVDGEPFCHNDILRAVHDLFGHVALGTGFGPRGEFAATGGHLGLYPRAAWPALFTEQIGQICWYFYGDHLPAAPRPYPEQKVFLYPQRFLDEFLAGVHPAR
ncbi:hypothetical protein [Actinokineospora inagensis]|uniref:hypothetical protein n=1 Tax=Actinokineospora inagensis TaxID=103730 RepID=UPI0003F85009|nr:hypothetical protein [Actinokineospora inagensis]